MTSNKTRIRIDLPMLITVSILAWALVDILHEIVGHAGAALLMGFPVKAVSTTTAFIDVDWPTVIRNQGAGPFRFVAVAGTLLNLITGALALVALRWQKVTGVTRYFLFFFATFSAVIVAMNLLTAPLLGVGDWTEFLTGLEPRSAWRAGIIAAGVVVTAAGYILPLRLWMPRLRGYRGTLLSLTVIPVVTVILVQTLSLVQSPFAALPPERNHLLASVFAYLHFVLWAILVNVCPVPRASAPVEAITLPRSRQWLVLGLVALVVYVLVLGPGLGSFAGDRRLE